MFGLLLLVPASIALGYLVTLAFFPGYSKTTYLEKDERWFFALGISVPAVLFGLFFVGQFAGINYLSLTVSYALIAALSFAIFRRRRAKHATDLQKRGEQLRRASARLQRKPR